MKQYTDYELDGFTLEGTVDNYDIFYVERVVVKDRAFILNGSIGAGYRSGYQNIRLNSTFRINADGSVKAFPRQLDYNMPTALSSLMIFEYTVEDIEALMEYISEYEGISKADW